MNDTDTDKRTLDPETLPPRDCDLCGSSDKRFLFKRFGYPIVHCNGCGLVFTDVEITFEQLARIYPKEFFESDADQRPEYSMLDYGQAREVLVHNFMKKLGKVGHLLPEGGRLLDVGCANGFFMDAVKNRWDVHGVDVSRYATDYAREKLGLENVTCGVIEELDLPDEHFRFITMWNSLDHVISPMAALKQANRLMETGGILVIYVEDIGSWLAKIMGRYWFPLLPPVHLTYFDKQTIKKALRAAGFETLANMKVGVDLRIQDVFNRLQCQGRSPLAYRIFRMLEGTTIGGLRFNFGSGGNMFVTARKTRDPVDEIT